MKKYTTAKEIAVVMAHSVITTRHFCGDSYTKMAYISAKGEEIEWSFDEGDLSDGIAVVSDVDLLAIEPTPNMEDCLKSWHKTYSFATNAISPSDFLYARAADGGKIFDEIAKISDV